jgi:hypothetical protein
VREAAKAAKTAYGRIAVPTLFFSSVPGLLYRKSFATAQYCPFWPNFEFQFSLMNFTQLI